MDKNHKILTQREIIFYMGSIFANNYTKAEIKLELLSDKIEVTWKVRPIKNSFGLEDGKKETFPNLFSYEVWYKLLKKKYHKRLERKQCIYVEYDYINNKFLYTDYHHPRNKGMRTDPSLYYIPERIILRSYPYSTFELGLIQNNTLISIIKDGKQKDPIKPSELKGFFESLETYGKYSCQRRRYFKLEGEILTQVY